MDAPPWALLGFLYDSLEDREKQECVGLGLGPRGVLLLSGEAPVPLLPILQTVNFLDEVKRRSKDRLGWHGGVDFYPRTRDTEAG